jgi:lysylphosphatidylglycerol synthetase-like protein (DUF2156 family)
MSIVISKVKNFLYFLKDSIKEVLIGSLLVLFSISGVITAAITRFLNFNGILISLIAIIVEIVGLIFSYLIFSTFFEEKEKDTETKKSKTP